MKISKTNKNANKEELDQMKLELKWKSQLILLVLSLENKDLLSSKLVRKLGQDARYSRIKMDLKIPEKFLLL